MTRTLTIPLSSGSEPEIEDCTEAVGSSFDFDDVTGDPIEPCAKSPSGQCEYSIADNFRRCVHCKQESGL